MKRLYGTRIFVDSVGLRRPREEDGHVDPFTSAVMDELGVDLAQHHAKTFDELEDASFDLVISLTPQAHHRAIELGRGRSTELEYWPTLDPSLAGGSRDAVLEAYREVRNALERRLIERFGPVRTFAG